MPKDSSPSVAYLRYKIALVFATLTPSYDRDFGGFMSLEALEITIMGVLRALNCLRPVD